MELTIRQRRVGLGLDQAQLAEQADVSQRAVSYAECRPHTVPHAEAKILYALDQLENDNDPAEAGP